MKKILFIATLLASWLPFSTAHAADVEIGTVEQLKAFRDAVNSGTQYTGKTVVLTADLDLSGEANWKPIGNLVAYPGQSFNGVFDGQNHTISNLTVNDNTPNYAVAGLFGSVVNGTIQNLTVKNVNIKSTHYAAGIVAYTSNAPSIINCHVIGGTISSTPEIVNGSYDNGDKAGGIMGYATAGSTITNCSVKDVTITAYRDMGGIVGYSSGTVTNNTVTNVTVTQDLTNGYKNPVPTTFGDVIGRNEGATLSGNEVVESNGVAQIGTTTYATLQDAIDAAEAGDVIELLQDIDLTTVTTDPSDKYNVNVNKSVTIDGKGYKITSSTGKRPLVLTGEGNNITLKNLTVVNNRADWCLGITNALTCTLDNTTIDGTNYSGSYNQPLTIGSIDETGRVTLNVTNGSVIKTNDAGSAHYAIIAWHPADITVTNSSLIGWANVYLKPQAEGSTVNISNSTLKSQGVAGATNNFSMFTTECGNNTITLTDNNISLAAAADTYMTLVTLNGSDNTVKVLGEGTTFTTNDATLGGISYRKGDFENNTVSFDANTHTTFAEAINVLKEEGVSDTEAEGKYTLGYTSEVYYYWFTDGVEAGENCDFADPFVKGWLCDGEFIRVKKDITLTANIACQLTSGSFTLTLGEYSITKGDYAVTLNGGVSVNTDKQTNIFAAAEGYKIVETAVEGGYTYTAAEITPVAQIGDEKFETLEEAFAAATDGQTITLLADCAGNGIKVPQGKFTTGLTVDFAGHTYTVDGETVGSTGTETNGFQLLKGNNITFKGGTITSTKAKILVQNYSNLTLEGMTLTLNNSGYTSAYTLSNNNGNIVIDGSTINANPAGGFAFDVCRYSSYSSVKVEVKGESVINGNIEIYASGSDAKDGFGLTLTAGTLNGKIVVDPTAAAAMEQTPEKATVTKANTFAAAAPEGYTWQDNGDGTYSVKPIAYVAQIGDTKYESLQEALDAAEAEDTPNIVINLLNDATLDITAWDGAKNPLSIGTANTLSITINGNGHTLTFNQKNSDWNNVATMNDAQTKLILNNMNITSSGYNDGPWNRHDINFNCAVEMNNVTSDKALAFKNDATLNNVTVNDTGDIYAIWVSPRTEGGQTISINGLDVTCGRGIKIDDQYVDAPVPTTLEIEDATFTTSKKSAILVKSAGGADITVGENIDITNVAADPSNIVWVDEDRADEYYNVTVTGANLIPEGGEVHYVASLVRGDQTRGYYATFAAAYNSTDFEDGDTYELLKTTTEAVEVAKALTIVKNGCTAANLTAAEGFKKTETDEAITFVTFNPVCEIAGVQYETLEAAFAAAEDGQTITLLANCAGNGIKVPQGKFTTGLTVDFAGFTYTVDGETVGSTGTETNGFQLLKGNNITFKGGTITSTKAKILVQNYSNLTLEGMTLTLNNSGYTSAYTLSNNNGNIVIDGSTINANPAGGFAFDVCRYSSYSSVKVEVKGESVINGNIEIYASGSDAKDGFGLKLTAGTLNGKIVVDATAAAAMKKTPENATVTKANTFTVDAPEGYIWQDNGDGTSKLDMPTVSVGSTGFATFSSTYALDFTNVENIYAYIAVVENGEVTYKRIRKVPAGTGLLLRNPEETSATAKVPVLASTATFDSTEGNRFVAVSETITALATAGDGVTNYILNNGSKGVGFYRANGKKVAAGKAYLTLDNAIHDVKALVFDEDDATGIAEVESFDEGTQATYNLAGQRVPARSAQKGIYIVNGKKIIK